MAREEFRVSWVVVALWGGVVVGCLSRMKTDEHLVALETVCNAFLKSVCHLLTKREKGSGKGMLMPCLLVVFG